MNQKRARYSNEFNYQDIYNQIYDNKKVKVERITPFKNENNDMLKVAKRIKK